jgi:hypothetical protein
MISSHASPRTRGSPCDDTAREERVTAAYVYTLLRLPWLAPDITTAIVIGRQPPQLNAKRLMRLTAHLPADWAEQRALLGFRRKDVLDSVNCSARYLFSGAASPKTRRQRVNHQIPAERRSPAVSKRQPIKISLRPERSRETPRKCRQHGRNQTTYKVNLQFDINYLVAGWGTEIRTRGCRRKLSV